jgi:hypothetical protein
MRRRFGRWLVMVIAIPVAAALLRRIADKVEERNGPDSKTAKGLRAGSKVLRPGA